MKDKTLLETVMNNLADSQEPITDQLILQQIQKGAEIINQAKLDLFQRQQLFNNLFPVNEHGVGLQTNPELEINHGNGSFTPPEFNQEYFMEF